MLCRVNVWFSALALLGMLQACGDDEKPPVNTADDDASVMEEPDDMFDAGPFPFEPPDPNDVYPGDPPEELAGQLCAAHTNKIYDLATTQGNAVPALLAVDRQRSRFGMAFVSAGGDACTSGVSFAELYGPPGAVEASPTMAYDDCTLIETAAIARGDGAWLLAVTDNRMEARDLWVHAFDPESGDTIAVHRVTENMAAEASVGLLNLDRNRALIVWTETAFDNTGTSLVARFLSGEGEPEGEPVELEAASDAFYTGMAMTRLGDELIGLVYRRDGGAGGHAIVLDVLSAQTAERDRDPWVLTYEAGALGTVDIASDSRGAGVAYTVVQGLSRQVWFQPLGLDGYAAPVESGPNTGGPADPNRIVGAPQLGVDVSLARMATGFAVAYRALPSVRVPVAQIRAHFLDRRGEILGDSAIALAAESGGQTALESAFDGNMVLSWSDSDDEGLTTLRSLVVPCGPGM